MSVMKSPHRSMKVAQSRIKVFQTLSGLITTIRQLVGQNQASLACIHKILSDAMIKPVISAKNNNVLGERNEKYINNIEK